MENPEPSVKVLPALNSTPGAMIDKSSRNSEPVAEISMLESEVIVPPLIEKSPAQAIDKKLFVPVV
jgi:hypothetical protein